MSTLKLFVHNHSSKGDPVVSENDHLRDYPLYGGFYRRVPADRGHSDRQPDRDGRTGH